MKLLRVAILALVALPLTVFADTITAPSISQSYGDGGPKNTLTSTLSSYAGNTISCVLWVQDTVDDLTSIDLNGAAMTERYRASRGDSYWYVFEAANNPAGNAITAHLSRSDKSTKFRCASLASTAGYRTSGTVAGTGYTSPFQPDLSLNDHETVISLSRAPANATSPVATVNTATWGSASGNVLPLAYVDTTAGSLFGFGWTGGTGGNAIIVYAIYSPEVTVTPPAAPHVSALLGATAASASTSLAAVGAVSADTFTGIWGWLILSVGLFVGFVVVQQYLMPLFFAGTDEKQPKTRKQRPLFSEKDSAGPWD